jgi:hypothetical protein
MAVTPKKKIILVLRTCRKYNRWSDHQAGVTTSGQKELDHHHLCSRRWLTCIMLPSQLRISRKFYCFSMQEHLNQHNMMCFPVVNILMDHEEHAPLVAHRLHAHVLYATPPPSSISTYLESVLSNTLCSII